VHRLFVRIILFLCSDVDDATYTTAIVWVESVYHTSDTACGGTDDDAFEAALCTDVHDVEVVRRIKQNEPVELRGRNTVLRGTKPTVGNPPTNYLKIHN